MPQALRGLGHDVRLILPAYPQAVERAQGVEKIADLEVREYRAHCAVLAATLGPEHLPVYLLHAPGVFDRVGNPYVGHDGHDWPDNPFRFTLFSKAVVALASDRAGLDWKPDLVHTNDWQTGLVPALLALEPERPATVFTIHNLAYQGVYPASSGPCTAWSSTTTSPSSRGGSPSPTG